MTDDDLLALLATHLDAVLTPAGFDEAQGGWHGITYCAPQDGFIERHPWLPQAHREGWQRGHCIDLTLEFDQTTGLLARAYLEEKTVASTLYAMREGALSSELKAAFGKPLEESLEVLARALGALFVEPESRITSEPFVEPA